MIGFITPYANPNGDPQERYNAAHKKARCLVERCIGIWKMCWRCLTKPIMFRPDRASRIMSACAALHNHAIKHRIDLNEAIDVELVNQYQDHVVVNYRANNRFRARDQLVQRVFTNI